MRVKSSGNTLTECMISLALATIATVAIGQLHIANLQRLNAAQQALSEALEQADLLALDLSDPALQ